MYRHEIKHLVGDQRFMWGRTSVEQIDIDIVIFNYFFSICSLHKLYKNLIFKFVVGTEAVIISYLPQSIDFLCTHDIHQHRSLCSSFFNKVNKWKLQITLFIIMDTESKFKVNLGSKTALWPLLKLSKTNHPSRFSINL